MFCTYRLTQKKIRHAHFNAHKPNKPVTPTIFMLDKKFKLKCISFVNTYRLIKKNLPRPL